MISESYSFAYSNELGEFGVEEALEEFFTSNDTMDLFPNLLTTEDVDLDSFPLLEEPGYEEVIEEEEEGEESSYSGDSTPPRSSEPNHNDKTKRGGRKQKEDGMFLSKNAIAARENRIKKKKYVQSLEESVRSLTSENRSLKGRTAVLEETADRLKAEVDYLHGILANVDEISALLKSVRNTSGLKVTCNVKQEHGMEVTAKRQRPNVDESNMKRLRSSTDRKNGGGVCFHVNSGQVSLEFCPQCSNNAAAVASTQR